MGVSSGKGRRLPGGRNTEIVVHVVIPVVVDVEPVGIELANVDTVAVRIERLPASIHVTEARGLPLDEPISFRF